MELIIGTITGTILILALIGLSIWQMTVIINLHHIIQGQKAQIEAQDELIKGLEDGSIKIQKKVMNTE